MNIKEALAKLDPSNDAHWTNDGMPRMDVVQKLLQVPELSRTEVTNAAPDFSRASVLAAEAVEPSKEDDNVEASSEPHKGAEASSEVTTFGEVMVEAVEPVDEAHGGAAPAPFTPEIAVSAPTTKMEALEAALAIHTDAMNAADSVKKDAIRAFQAASDQVNTLNRQIDAIVKADPHAATAGIRDYIAMQNKLRYDKANAARKFLGDSGSSPRDVAKALEVRSDLDKAFLGRKAPRGSKRPVYNPQG